MHLTGEAPISSTPQLQLLRGIGAQLEGVRQAHPAWHADFEDSDPHTADRETVARLLATAPNDYCRGLVAGVLFEQDAAEGERAAGR